VTHFACITIKPLVFKTEQRCKMAKKAGLVSYCSFNEISFVNYSHWIQQVFIGTDSNINADSLVQKRYPLNKLG
jgi:hypothetical protein